MDIVGYKLSGEVEVGKFSTIFTALDEQGKTVLIKVFNKELSTNTVFRTHFKAITEKLLQQEFPGNVHMLDSKLYDDACILVMDHHVYYSSAAEETLTFSDTEVLEIGRQLASGLSLFHKQKIVHGGVELSNLSISEDKEAVLGVVALQRTMPGGNAIKLAVGQVEDIVYRAPEANSGLTASTDFYALGVLLYELLVGRKPFDTENIATLQQAKEKGDYLPLGDEHKYLAPLFKKLLSPKPQMRASSVYEFEFILSRCESKSSRQNNTNGVDLGLFPNKNTVKHSQAPPAKKAGFLRPAIVGVSILSVLGLLAGYLYRSADNSPEKNGAEVVVSPGESEIKDGSIVATPSQQQSSEGEIISAADLEPNSLYASAKSLVDKGDYKAALQSINTADTADSNSEDLKKLKVEIQKELNIRSLVATAEAQFENNKLVLPPGDNALESYHEIRLLVPENDDRASGGEVKIADYYLKLAGQHKNKSMFDDAKNAIDLGLRAKPGYEPLLKLKTSLDGDTSNKSKIVFVEPDVEAEQLPQGIAAADKNKGNNNLDTQMESGNKTKEQNSKEENQLQTVALSESKNGKEAVDGKSQSASAIAIESEKNAKQQNSSKEDQPKEKTIAKEKENHKSEDVANIPISKKIVKQPDAESAWQIKLEEIKQSGGQQQLESDRVVVKEINAKAAEKHAQLEYEAEINTKIASAESQLLPNQLSGTSLQAATDNYESLKETMEKDARVSGLHEKIMDSYVVLAHRQEKANQLPGALTIIDKGLALNNRHRELLTMKKRINKLLNRHEKWKKAGPVIGTF
jgi:serine/threonine protein kinase